MKILIIGAGLERSIGTMLAEYLRKAGHTVLVVSRSGKIGVKCDATDPDQLLTIVSEVQPEAIIYAAGCFPEMKKIGEIQDWNSIRDLIFAKTTGALVTLNAAVKYGTQKVIFMAGSQVSSDSRLSHFAIANGALWDLVRFANKHTQTEVFYIELGLVAGSTMSKDYLAASEDVRESAEKNSVSFSDVFESIDNIIRQKIKKGRVIINQSQI